MRTARELHAMFERLRLCQGITLRVIEAFPEDALHRQVIPNMRTPAELLVHMMQTTVRNIPEGVARGAFEEPPEAPTVERLTSKEALLAFSRECWAAGEATVAAMTDAQLTGEVTVPWGAPVRGGDLMAAIRDEYLHHRGQLYAFLRAAGGVPPDMWDFRNNAPEYRPRSAAATA